MQFSKKEETEKKSNVAQLFRFLLLLMIAFGRSFVDISFFLFLIDDDSGHRIWSALSKKG